MSRIIQPAAAGTLESSDAFVMIEPHQGGLVIEIESVVQNQFGQSIRQAAQEELARLEVQDAKLSVTDRGALDCVLRARIEAAVLRGRGEG